MNGVDNKLKNTGSNIIAEQAGWSFGGDVANNFDDHVESIKGEFKGIELSGKNIGIIGLGSIGVSVANSCAELGMNVFGFDPLMTVENAWKLSRNVNRIDILDDLVGLSDFVTIHVPLVEQTRGLLGKNLLQFKSQKF